jgi:hypothetical protein
VKAAGLSSQEAEVTDADIAATLELQALVARFANSFDLKDWESLGDCLAEQLRIDYRELRGTAPETVSREEFVRQRRAALQELQTHHLAGNVETEMIDARSARLRVSACIHRRGADGQTLTSHCLYFMSAERHADGGWRLSAIRQKVFL